MSVKTRTSYYIEHDDHEFEMPMQPIDGTEKVTIIGEGLSARAVVSYLSQDEANGWYFDENDQGTFINNDSRCRGDRKTPEEIAELKAAHPDRFFVIHKYEHGQCRYYRAGDAATSATIPDQQWDVSHGAAFYIAPDDTPDPVKYCDSVMEEFTNWCNGEIYGVCHAFFNKVSKDGDEFEWVEAGEHSPEECWGYIGGDYAQQTLEEEHASHVKELNT
jgi:hypothetical protein